MTEILATLALAFSGLSAGALMVALVVLLPLLMTVPEARYPWTNTFVLDRMDKLMPVMVGAAVLTNATVAVLSDALIPRVLFGTAAICFLGVFAISLGVLGPLNARIRTWDGVPAPEGALPRARRTWRSWHITRGVGGQIGVVLCATALALWP